MITLGLSERTGIDASPLSNPGQVPELEITELRRRFSDSREQNIDLRADLQRLNTEKQQWLTKTIGIVGVVVALFSFALAVAIQHFKMLCK
jgi:hypothetical protein